MNEILVTELIDGWEYNVDDVNGITGIRKFLYINDVTNTLYGPSAASLPAIGDIFEDIGEENINDSDAGYKNLYCRNIDIEPLQNDGTQYIFVCTYSNLPTDKTQWENGKAPNQDDLPFSMDIAGEIELIEPDQVSGELYNWSWTLDIDPDTELGNPVKQGLPLKVASANIRLTRILLDADYSTFKQYCDKIKGRVNKENFTLRGIEYQAETILFNSYTAEKYLDHIGNYKWKVEMLFCFRSPEWNLQINKLTSWWDKPYNDSTAPNPYTPDNLYTYGRVDFSFLFKNTPGLEVIEE